MLDCLHSSSRSCCAHNWSFVTSLSQNNLCSFLLCYDFQLVFHLSLITNFCHLQDVPLPTKKKVHVKASATPTTRSKDQSFVTHSNNNTLNLDVYTPFIRNTSQQKGIVTSTPAEGMVGVEPPVHIGAPTPILPQGIATYTRSQVGSGGTAAIKKTSKKKKKTQTGVSKKTVVKSTGT